MENDSIMQQQQQVTPVPAFIQPLAVYINSLQEVTTQFQIWHWNTKAYVHLATEEVYKGLIDPIDALAESYVVLSKQPYRRERNPEFTPEWSADFMNKICISCIDQSNKLAESIPDEAIKGILGNIIQIFRTVMFKIG